METIETPLPGITYGPLTYTHRLLKGVTQVSNYGLRLMMTTSLPESMKKEAARVVECLSSKRSNCLALAKIVRQFSVLSYYISSVWSKQFSIVVEGDYKIIV